MFKHHAEALFFSIGERATKLEVLGTAIALSGAVWLTSSDFWASRQTLLWDVTCFVSMLLFSMYLVQARRIHNLPNFWLYPIYPSLYHGGSDFVCLSPCSLCAG
jgi:drug/metabolite transporter (DMT)-like permease